MTTNAPNQGATFRFNGRFTYADEATQQEALASFAEDSSLFRGPPIPLDLLRRDGLALALDFERTTDISMEWTGLLDQVGALAIAATGGELIAVYDGWSASVGGRKVQRVRIRPGPELDDPDEAPAKPKKAKAKAKTVKKAKSKKSAGAKAKRAKVKANPKSQSSRKAKKRGRRR